MSVKPPKKRIVPTLVSTANAANAANDNAANAAKAFEAAAQKKNPLENAADMIAMRYGISEEAPQIDEEIFKKNRALGKKVVPLKEYFEQTAKEFVQKEAEKKEEATRKKREYAKLTPCQRKTNTLQRNIDGYIKDCDRAFSNEALIEMMDKAREKAARASTSKKATKATKAAKATKATKATKASRESRGSRTSNTPRGGRTRRKLRK
jgi:hypothetical protein